MRVVVVGGGIAGMEFVRHACRLPIEITLIEPKPFMVCQALLPELLSDKIDVDDICIDIGEFCDLVGVELVKDRAFEVKDGLIVTGKGKEIDYDQLVMAVGAEANYYGVKGSDKTYNVNTLESTLKTKKALENAEEVAVVGSGTTGVEVALELREVGYDVRIVELADRILPTFSQKVSDLVYKIMKDDGIEVYTSHRVLEIDDGIVTDKGKIECDVVIWCAGIKPQRFVEDLNVPKVNGWIKVDEFLKAKDLFAIGDCAFVRIDGEIATKTALEARMQAKHMALNLSRLIRNESPVSYKIRSSLSRPTAIITLARNRAILIYRGYVLSKPMNIIYKLKKMAVGKFLNSYNGKPSK